MGEHLDEDEANAVLTEMSQANLVAMAAESGEPIPGL